MILRIQCQKRSVTHLKNKHIHILYICFSRERLSAGFFQEWGSVSHLLIFTPSHLHTFSHIFSSSHLLIFTPSLTSSHLLIFTSSHLHIFSSSHLFIFTSSHLHIFSSSHLLIFTSAHLHIFLSSHLLIFTSVHLHISIFTYSHLLFLSLSPLSSLLSLSPFSLPFLSLAFFIFLSLGRGWCRRGVTKRESFRTKWGSIGKNWSKIAILLAPNEGRSAKTEVKLRFYLSWSNPFRTKWGSIGENWSKIAILLVPEQPFRTKWGSIGKNWSR